MSHIQAVITAVPVRDRFFDKHEVEFFLFRHTIYWFTKLLDCLLVKIYFAEFIVRTVNNEIRFLISLNQRTLLE